MAQAIRILDHVGKKANYNRDYRFGYAGGAGYEHHGEHFPDSTKQICIESDAILFGSVG